MKSRLDLAAIEVRTNPVVQAFTSLMIPGTDPNFHSLLPTKAALVARLPMRHLSSGPLMLGDKFAGKLHSFTLQDKPVYVELTIFKTGGGYKPTRRHLYLEASIENDHGEVTVRVHNGMVYAVRGPLRLLDSKEALAAFGPKLFKATSQFSQQRDGAVMGIGLSGLAMSRPTRTVRTIDEAGEETQITIRRRRRAVEI